MSNKIFLIEDDENILYGLQDRFTSSGYTIEISDASEEMDDLIKRVKEKNPDYVILDLVLPKLDGMEIIKRLKNDEESNNNLQILIFTDLSEEDCKSRSVGLGVNHYFLKSDLDVNEFADRVEEIIEGGSEEVKEAEEEDASEDLVLE